MPEDPLKPFYTPTVIGMTIILVISILCVSAYLLGWFARSVIP